MNIYFSLIGQTLRRTDNKQLASDSVNFIQAFFIITQLSSYSWEAKLSKDTITYTSYPLEEKEDGKYSLVIPKEYLSNEENNANLSFYISLIGKNEENNVIITSNTVEVKLQPSLYRKTLKPMTPSEAKAIEKQIADLRRVVTDAQAAIDTLETISTNNTKSIKDNNKSLSGCQDAIETTNSNIATLSTDLAASQEKINNMLNGTESFSTIAATGALNFGKAISFNPYEWWSDDGINLFEDSFTFNIKMPHDPKHSRTISIDGNTGQVTASDLIFSNLSLDNPNITNLSSLDLSSTSLQVKDLAISDRLNITGGTAILMGANITLEDATVEGNHFSVFNGSTNAANLTELSILKHDEDNPTVWNNCYTLDSTGITIPPTKTFSIKDGIGTVTFNTGDIVLKDVSTIQNVLHVTDAKGNVILKTAGTSDKPIYFGTTNRPCHYYGVSWEVDQPIQPTTGIADITMYHNAAQLYTGNAVAQKQINITIPADIPMDYKSCFEIYASKGCTFSFTRGKGAMFILYDDADKPLSSLTLESDAAIFVEARRVKTSMVLLTYTKTHLINSQTEPT